MEGHHLTVQARDHNGVVHIVENVIDVLVTVHPDVVNAQPPPPHMRIGPDGTITPGPILTDRKPLPKPDLRKYPPYSLPGPPYHCEWLNLQNALYENYMNSLKYLLTRLT